MDKQTRIRQIRRKYRALEGELDERGRRCWAATEARDIGWGGVTIVAAATGMSDRTIRNGIVEINARKKLEPYRNRRQGGGRKSLIELRGKLSKELDALVDPTSRGNPVSPLRWTIKSTRTLANALREKGFEASHSTVSTMLRKLGYSLQSNRKTREGGTHPDRNEQFIFINSRVKHQQKRQNPAISVDTKKKEVLGLKKNSGRTYQKKAAPIHVDVYDFIDEKLGKAVPYGVYDLKRNEAGVSVGVSSDTAEFAVAAISRWWNRLGQKRYRNSDRILVTADCGGSNGYKNRLWKVELQKFADTTGKVVEVCHFPPGTSKWNKIEHRLFCHITRNWRGVPLETLEIVVQLIANTRTETGLEVHAWLDSNTYEKGRKISDRELDECNLVRNQFHGEWNYEIIPRKPSRKSAKIR